MNFISERTMLAVKVAAQALFLYGLSAWLYRAVIQVTQTQ